MTDLQSCRRPIAVVLPAPAYWLLLGATFNLPGYCDKDGYELAHAFVVVEANGSAQDLQLIQLSRVGFIPDPTRLVIVPEGTSPVRRVTASIHCSGLHAGALIGFARAVADSILDEAALTSSGHRMLPARAGLAKGMDEAVDRYRRRS
jgi:hypothetical protein